MLHARLIDLVKSFLGNRTSDILQLSKDWLHVDTTVYTYIRSACGWEDLVFWKSLDGIIALSCDYQPNIILFHTFIRLC